MKTVAHKIKKIGKHILAPIRRFLSDSRAVGISLITCTFLSILLANLPSVIAAITGFIYFYRLHLKPATAVVKAPAKLGDRGVPVFERERAMSAPWSCCTDKIQFQSQVAAC